MEYIDLGLGGPKPEDRGGEGTQRTLPLSFEHHVLKAKRMRVGDWQAVQHYARPKLEYRAITRDAGILDVTWLSFTRIAGADARRVLERYFTCPVAKLREGESVRGFLLDERASIQADVEFFAMEDSILAVSPPALPPDRLIRLLTRDLLTEEVIAEDVSGDLCAIAVLGHHAPWVYRAVPLRTPAPATGGMLKGEVAHHGVNVFHCRTLGGIDVVLCRENVASAVWQALLNAAKNFDGMAVGWDAWNAWRIESGIPVFGIDFGPGTNPRDAGLERFVDMTKESPFPGRREMARILENPTPDRRFCGLILDTQDEPTVPAPMRFPGGLTAGAMTSYGFSRRLNKYIALGLIKYQDPLPMSPMIVHRTEDSSYDAQAVILPFPGLGEDFEDTNPNATPYF